MRCKQERMIRDDESRPLFLWFRRCGISKKGDKIG